MQENTVSVNFSIMNSMPAISEDRVNGKVVVCGLETEEPTSLLLDSLKAAEADYLFLDQRDFAGDLLVRWQMTRDGIKGIISTENSTILTDQISSVFMRMMPVELMGDYTNREQEAERIRSVNHSLVQFFDILPGRIVNRRRPMMSNNSKPYQSILIKKAGFQVPDTFITSDPKKLLNNPIVAKPMIFKSMSSTRSIVKTADLGDIKKLSTISNLPTQFQEKIQGYCVRVHVIGETVFATRIHSNATDYRYAALENTGSILVEMELNCELKRKCLNLAKSLKLNFCGIDLMIAEDKTVCLEVNPCPGYSYYQKVTGQPISDALASYLMFKED